MSNQAAVIIAEIPVVTGAAFGVVAWFVNRMTKRQDEHEADLAEGAVKVAGLESRTTALEATTAVLDRRLPTIGENLAIVAAFVERHERWHERHDPQHRGDGGS